MEFANAQAACLYRERLKRERESSTVPMIAKARAMMIASNSSLASRKTERAKIERTSVSVPGIITGKHATTTTTNRSIDRCRQRRRGRSSKHRNLAIEVLSEIRTTGAAQKAAKVLGLSNDDARDERKLKRAYRRNALRTHPDTGGKTASAEQFQDVQKAYRLLRLEIASPNNEVLAKEISRDEEWEDHDWRWRQKYEREKALDENVNAQSEKKRAEVFQRLEEMKRRAALKMKSNSASNYSDSMSSSTGSTDHQQRQQQREGEGEGEIPPSSFAFSKKKKRTIKPVSRQTSPMEHFQRVQEAEKIRKAKEAEAVEKRINFKAFGGPDASKHSTNSAHDMLNTQLDGLRRKQVLKARYGGGLDEQENVETKRKEAMKVRRYQLELEDSEEERFMRLAKVANEWRKRKGGVHSWRDTGSTSDDDKMSARELLLAAVQSVALGAHQ